MRTLLIGVTLVCLVLTLVPYRAREYQQRKDHAQQMIVSLGGTIDSAGWSKTPSPGTNWLSLAIGYGEQLESRWKVDLAGTAVSPKDLEELGSCEWIRVLDLSNTKIGDDAIDRIARIKKLRELHLANTQVTDAGIARLNALDDLIVLDVANTAVTYDGLASLERHFPGASFQDQLAVARCKNGRIWFLAFATSSSKSQDELDMFPPPMVPAERTISINYGIAITPNEIEDIRHLKQVTEFISHGALFPQGGLEFLADLPNLRSVLIDDGAKGNLTDRDLKWLAQVPHLKRLSLNSRNLTDAGFANLENAHQLEELAPTGRELTPALIGHLRGLRRISRLRLNFWYRGSEIDDRRGPTKEELLNARDAIKHLADIPNLRDLDIMGNLVVDEALDPLESLTTLEELRLDWRYVNPTEVNRLKAALPDCAIGDVNSPPKPQTLQ